MRDEYVEKLRHELRRTNPEQPADKAGSVMQKAVRDRLRTVPSGPSVPIPPWRLRHQLALKHPEGAELPIIHMLTGWLEYEHNHFIRQHQPIDDDYLLRCQWFAIGEAIRGLLGGEIGRLDASCLDSVILDGLHRNGWEERGLSQLRFSVSSFA